MTISEMLSNALARVIAFLPNLLAALLILVVGLIIASFLARVARRLVGAIQRRESLRKLVDDQQMLERLPRIAGHVVYWPLALITIGLAIDALELAWLSAGVARVLAYLPNVLAAALILVGAYLLATYLYRRATRREARVGPEGQTRLWPEVLRAGIYGVAAFMALQELGIATTIVTSAFIIVLGAIAVAGAIAFGLGNRELAGRIMRDWYDRRQIEREEMPEFSTEAPPPAHH